MAKKQNLTGKTFNDLFVIREVVNKSLRSESCWECLCKCGNIVEVSLGNLKRNRTCGCSRNQELTNKTFDRITALFETGRDKWGNKLWYCKCQCGNHFIVTGTNLLRGNKRSCGCLQKEMASTSIKEYLKTHKKDLHPCWKGGISTVVNAIRNIQQYHDWRLSVYKRDTFTCVNCGSVGKKLNAHHINSFSNLIDRYNITSLEAAINCSELWNIDNGVTLCVDCHRKVHRQR